jgi:hypothetical protein
LKPITPAIATALHHLVSTIDLSAVQVVEQGKGEDWTDAVCTARDALPEGTMIALAQLGSASSDALALATESTSLLDLAINSAERGFKDETLLHLGKLGAKLEALKGMLYPDGKET